MCTSDDMASTELAVGQAESFLEPSPVRHQDAVIVSNEQVHFALRSLEH